MIQLQGVTYSTVLTPTTAASASRSASFDWLGSDYAAILVNQSAGSGTNGGIASVQLLHSDDNTTFVTVATNLGTQATTSHNMIYLVDLKTAKRYGKIIITPTTGTNDAVITSAYLIAGRKESQPSSTAGMVGSTNDNVTIVTTPGV